MTPRILTNMRFWQSDLWANNTVSVYAPGATEDSSAIAVARKLFAARRKYDVVHTMGARESLYYGLIAACRGTKSKQIMGEVFIDHPCPMNPLWQCKQWLYRWVARRSIGIITNSSAEINAVAQRFRIDPARIRFVALNSDITEPGISERDEGYVFSAGRTLRDYATLLRAVEDIDIEVRIVCGEHDLPRGKIPCNVRIMREIERPQYLHQLRNCSLVVVPLQETARSTGQVVMLEAMALGKPVIATESPGTLDYIDNGRNGILVPYGNVKALKEAIQTLLQDRGQSRELAIEAISDVREKYTPERHARTRLEAIADLWKTYGDE